MSAPRVHVIHVPGAQPARDAIVQRLRDEMDACVHEDPDRRGGMWNWLQAATCAATTDPATVPWSLIVQDDAEPLQGWPLHLTAALRHSPSPFLTLTHAGKYGQVLFDKGHPYGVGRCVTWGTAIAYHRSVMAPLASWAQRLYDATKYPHDDITVCGFAHKHRLQTAMTSRAIFWTRMPSLVGHSGPQTNYPTCTIANTPPLSYAAPPGRLSAGGGWLDTMEKMASDRWADL